MAKKKSKKGVKRRRSVGALSPSSPLVKLGSIALGYLVAAKPANDAIDKAVKGKVSTTIIGAGTTGLGAYFLMSKKPSLVKSVAGGVVAGIGLKRLKDKFMPANPAPVPPAVTGFRNVPVVGGFRQTPVVAGYNIGSNGYKVGQNGGSAYPLRGRALNGVAGVDMSIFD